VLKLLFRLQQQGVLEVAEIRPSGPSRATLLDDRDLDDESVPTPASGSSGEQTLRAGGDAEVEIEAARRLIRRGEHEAAIALLCATRRAHPRSSEGARLLEAADRGRTAYELEGKRR
jgi:hypothetical protein